MNEERIARLCLACFSQAPGAVSRCAAGHGNYVYRVEMGGAAYILRCSKERDAYGPAARWLRRLAAAGVPVPAVVRRGEFQGYAYILLTFLEGRDLGLAYPELSSADKREIARTVVDIQERAALLGPGPVGPGWSWRAFAAGMLARARERIVRNGYFDPEKADRLREQAASLEDYFAGVGPTVYLDDVSTKNLLIHRRRVSGVVDVDWIGVGDRLTYIALTHMALLNEGYDTEYVRYLLEETRATGAQRRAFLFYTLLYCVDFMGERGTRFLDRQIEVNPQVVDRLNGIYDRLWARWLRETGRR